MPPEVSHNQTTAPQEPQKQYKGFGTILSVNLKEKKDQEEEAVVVAFEDEDTIRSFI